MAKQKTPGTRATEFGGVPGLYGNIDPDAVRKGTKATDGKPYTEVAPISPEQTAMSARQTDSIDPNSGPEYGDGGVRVQ